MPVATDVADRTAMLPQTASPLLVRLYGNDGTLLSCHYDGSSINNNVNINNSNIGTGLIDGSSVNCVKGPDGLYIDRTQRSHITI